MYIYSFSWLCRRLQLFVKKEGNIYVQNGCNNHSVDISFYRMVVTNFRAFSCGYTYVTKNSQLYNFNSIVSFRLNRRSRNALANSLVSGLIYKTNHRSAGWVQGAYLVETTLKARVAKVKEKSKLIWRYGRSYLLLLHHPVAARRLTLMSCLT